MSEEKIVIVNSPASNEVAEPMKRGRKPKTEAVNLGDVKPKFDWRRKDRTALDIKLKGRRYYHATEENVAVKSQQGWTKDDTQKSHLPGHVVMWMPEEMAQSREAYFHEQDRINKNATGSPSNVGPTAFETDKR